MTSIVYSNINLKFHLIRLNQSVLYVLCILYITSICWRTIILYTWLIDRVCNPKNKNLQIDPFAIVVCSP